MEDKDFSKEIEEFQILQEKVETKKKELIIAETTLKNKRVEYQNFIRQVEDLGINIKDLPSKIKELEIEISKNNENLRQILK